MQGRNGREVYAHRFRCIWSTPDDKSISKADKLAPARIVKGSGKYIENDAGAQGKLLVRYGLDQCWTGTCFYGFSRGKFWILQPFTRRIYFSDSRVCTRLVSHYISFFQNI